MITSDLINDSYYKHTINVTDRIITGFYCGDLLSFVMGHAKTGEILLTITNNMNTIAVASLLDLPGIIFCEGVEPTREMIKKADEENILLLSTHKTKVEVLKEYLPKI